MVKAADEHFISTIVCSLFPPSACFCGWCLVHGFKQSYDSKSDFFSCSDKRTVTNLHILPEMATTPPLFLGHVLTLDRKFSLLLHTYFRSFLPSFLLLLLELSADFRFSFPISLFLALSLSSLSPFLSPLLFGLLLDLALIGLIKVVFRRPRPPYNPNMSPAVSADNFSFPSGHASRVFFIASLVSLSESVFVTALAELRARGDSLGLFVNNYVGEERKAAEIVVLVVKIWAVITALSRVLLGRHFFLDVLTGAFIGVFEGLFAFRFLRFDEVFSLLLFQRV